MLICILTKNVITSCSVTMMLFLHLEVKPLMTLTTVLWLSCFFFQAEDGIRDLTVTGVQTCALPIYCDTVWFGAAAPLGLLAQGLRRRAGVHRAVAQTHGHEVGWAALPGARQTLRRIGRTVDVSTYLSEYQRARLAPVLPNLERLTPGVDTEAFHPSIDGDEVRKRYGLSDRPVVVCVSRLVPRKGQDALIRALPAVRRRVPGAALLIVSGGPD